MLPIVDPLLLLLGQGGHVGYVFGIGDIPVGGFEILLEVFGFEDIAVVGEGQVAEDSRVGGIGLYFFLEEESPVIVELFGG